MKTRLPSNQRTNRRNGEKNIQPIAPELLAELENLQHRRRCPMHTHTHAHARSENWPKEGRQEKKTTKIFIYNALWIAPVYCSSRIAA